MHVFSGSTRPRSGCATAVALASVACTSPAPPESGELATEAAETAVAAPTDARYVTHLLFAAADGVAFSGSFDQTAEQSRLARAYEVWWTEGQAWAPLVDERDTLPVGRAAWRLLPASDMSVRIGDAGQVVSLGFVPDGEDQETVRLQAGEELSVWTGPTGQRESLGLAVLEAGDRAVPGILFFRRAARALRIPATADAARTFVLADSLGNGLLIHEGTGRQPAVAHTWLHGIESAWGDVIVEPVDSVADPTSWRFAIPGTDLSGELIPVAETGVGAGSAMRLEAVLSAGGEEFRFVGLTATLAFP